MNSGESFILLLLLLLLNSHTVLPISKKSLQIIEENEAFVNRLAVEAESIFRKRSRLLKNPCDCSVHICRTEFSQNACSLFLPQVDSVCGKGTCIRDQPGPISYIQTPPEQDVTSLSPQVKESICLYKHMEPIFLSLDPKPLTTTSISTSDGHSRIYPGTKRKIAIQEEGDKRRRQCNAAHQTRTAEYIGAGTGPKDIVFVVDSTANMAKPWKRGDKTSRLHFMTPAIVALLDTLSAMDSVNLVAYTDRARRIGTGRCLYPGTRPHLQRIRSTISSLHPYGNATVRDGIKTGFELLVASDKKRKRNRLFTGGQKVLVVIAADGEIPPKRASPFLKSIERKQREMKRNSSTRVTIFTFLVGERADNALLKQLACRSGGAWFSIGPDDDPFDILHRYNIFLASTFQATNPIWTNRRRDSKKADAIVTVAKAFRFSSSTFENAILLGVVHHEVSVGDLVGNGTTRKEVEFELRRRSRRHDVIDNNVCQLQIFRNLYAHGRICTDLLPIQSESKKSRRKVPDRLKSAPCFKYDGVYYKTVLDRLSWREANASCIADGGVLAQLTSTREQAFLAGMASDDGTWIGALGNRRGTKLHWLSRDQPGVNLSSIANPKNANFSGLCVRLENHAVVENLHVARCHQRLSYMCMYRRKTNCHRLISAPKRGYFTTPALDLCVQEEETLANLDLLSPVSFLPSSNFWCSLQNPQRDLQSLCCQKCDKQTSKKAEPPLGAEENSGSLVEDM